jgi:hypothetical protein
LNRPRYTRKSANGTSYFGTTIKTTPQLLKKIFGFSYHESNDGRDKTNIEFTLETSDGKVFTIYDWKLYRPYDDNELIDFHIGGHSQSVTEQAKDEIFNEIKNQKYENSNG